MATHGMTASWRPDNPWHVERTARVVDVLERAHGLTLRSASGKLAWIDYVGIDPRGLDVAAYEIKTRSIPSPAPRDVVCIALNKWTALAMQRLAGLEGWLVIGWADDVVSGIRWDDVPIGLVREFGGHASGSVVRVNDREPGLPFRFERMETIGRLEP